MSIASILDGIERATMAEEEKSDIEKLQVWQVTLDCRVAKLEKQVESISMVLNVALLAVLIWAFYPTWEKMLFSETKKPEVAE